MNKVWRNGKWWFRCDHLTNLMRKVYGFRMIGEFLYVTPFKRKRMWGKILNDSSK